MKSLYFVISYTLVFVLIKDAHGGLIPDQLDFITKPVKQITNIINLNGGSKNQPTPKSEEASKDTTTAKSEVASQAATTAKSEVASQAATTAKSEVTSQAATTAKSEVASPAATVTEETTTPVAAASTTVASANDTTTDKDGRAIITGSCSTGYQRTPDGRCMPMGV